MSEPDLLGLAQIWFALVVVGFVYPALSVVAARAGLDISLVDLPLRTPWGGFQITGTVVATALLAVPFVLLRNTRPLRAAFRLFRSPMPQRIAYLSVLITGFLLGFIGWSYMQGGVSPDILVKVGWVGLYALVVLLLGSFIYGAMAPKPWQYPHISRKAAQLFRTASGDPSSHAAEKSDEN